MDIFERQLALENEGINMGVERYMSKVRDGQLSDLPAGLILIKNALNPLAEALKDYCENEQVRASNKMYIEYYRQFRAEDLAYFTLRRCVNAITERMSLQNAAMQLAQDLVDHIEYQKYAQEAKGHLKVVERNLGSATAAHRRRVIMRAKRLIGVTDTKRLSKKEQVQLGSKLINFCVQHTGLIQKGVRINSPQKKLYVLEATERVTAWINTKHEQHALMSPVYMPMLCEPRDWTTPFDGGYLSNEATMRVRLVRTDDNDALLALAEHDMPEVYKAVNSLQKVAWKINTQVLDVAKELWRCGIAVGDSLVSRDNLPLPPKPWSTDAEYEQMQASGDPRVAEWKRDATIIHDRNAKAGSKRLAIMQQFSLAERFSGEERIYFPWNMDFRGRLYPVPSYVTPQGDDLGSALLHFAEGKRLGTSGVRWLAIHGANTFGEDKISLDDRVKWAEEHTAQIIDVANNPLDNLWWTDADKPFHFLAFCFEWAGYKSAGEDYVSHLNVQLDGSCNGIQHFSAMLLDARGGASVNLVPHDKPADIYTEVADVVRQMVVEDAANGNEYAQWWQDKITRKICKRGVMTTPYGVTKRGMIDQISEELQKSSGKANHTLTEKPQCDSYKASAYLGGILWKAIGRVIVASRSAMDWLQAQAKVASGDTGALTWTTPSGFMVWQKYVKLKTLRLETYWGKVRIALSILEKDTDKQGKEAIDKRRMANGIAPNFVHSMDASHLVLTLNRMDGKAFSPIHDSFGTHACDCEQLSQVLREEFLKMYTENDVLARFHDELIAQLPPELAEKIAAPPEKGDLDLSSVLGADYFFA